jgi:type II secretory pathway component PulF
MNFLDHERPDMPQISISSIPPVLDRPESVSTISHAHTSRANSAVDSKHEKSLTVLIAWNIVLLLLIQVAMIFVIPVFAAMFADFRAKLPMPTKMLLNCTEFFKRWWWRADPLIALVIFGAFYLTKRITPRRQLKFSAILQLLLLIAMGVSAILPIFQIGQKS